MKILTEKQQLEVHLEEVAKALSTALDLDRITQRTWEKSVQSWYPDMNRNLARQFVRERSALICKILADYRDIIYARLEAMKPRNPPLNVSEHPVDLRDSFEQQ